MTKSKEHSSGEHYAFFRSAAHRHIHPLMANSSSAHNLKISNTNQSNEKPIQRVILSTPPGPGQHFYRQGRSGRHSSAANKRALRAIILDRQANPNPAARHMNNEYEAGIVGGALHIAHHISDENVQTTVATAANNYNLGAGAAAWTPVQNMINGINPGATPVALPANFQNPAIASWNQANFRLGNLMGMVAPIPYTPAIRRELTILASSIANSPMNLHYGLGQTNMSIGQHGDANSHNIGMPPSPLTRQLSWRSVHMANSVGAANLNYRTHAAAAAMPGTVAGAHAVTFVPPVPLPVPVVHSSGSANFFTAFQ